MALRCLQRYKRIRSRQHLTWKPSDILTSPYLNMCAQSYPSLCDPLNCSPPSSSVRGLFQVSTGVGCHSLLRATFLTQGLNPHLVSPVTAGGFLTTVATWEASPHVKCWVRGCSMLGVYYVWNIWLSAVSACTH